MSQTQKQRLGHVPRQFAGKWIACTLDGKTILGTGESLQEARQAAESSGATSRELAYEWVPQAEARYIGNPNV
ncbi:MAG: hypothetical protein KDA68_09490 [Planctomycetaceae bacterium]|nr:hypothetical protein [Planctomycetaceae bacterium]